VPIEHTECQHCRNCRDETSSVLSRFF
jgi:hypothetical protein